MSRLIDADELVTNGWLLCREKSPSHITVVQSIADVPTAYDVEKVIEQTHKIFVDELEIIEKGIPEGGEYTEEAYRILYLNKKISDAIRDGGKE